MSTSTENEMADDAAGSGRLGGLGGRARSRQMQQRQLADRSTHEEVDDRVAVVGGSQVLVGADPVDGLWPLRVAGEDAVLDQGLERS